MAMSINNSLTSIVPAVYGTATPVVDVDGGVASVNAAAALSSVRSVVVNLSGPVHGGVTYSAAGLVDEMSAPVLARAPASSPGANRQAPPESPVTPASLPQTHGPAFYNRSGLPEPASSLAATPTKPGNLAASTAPAVPIVKA